MPSVAPRSPFLLFAGSYCNRQLKYDAFNRVCTGGARVTVRESTRLPPVWSGFKSRRPCHMWVESVFGSLLCCEVFLRVLRFSLSSTTNTSKFQFEMKRTDTFQRVLKNSLVLRLDGKQIINNYWMRFL